MVDPSVTVGQQEIVEQERAKGRTAEQADQLVGWSRATLYRRSKQWPVRMNSEFRTSGVGPFRAASGEPPKAPSRIGNQLLANPQRLR
ncbi:hypothetical protein J2Y41_003862 [Arthrobacter sp. 1088]|nr:hypothetical protein [Arthrobacter sp. 1088]